MKKLRLIFSLIVLSFIFSTASFAAHANFTSYLTGDQEAPTAVITSAKGTGTFTLTGAGGLRYAFTVTGLSGPIMGAQFQIGGLKVSGPILYDITSSFIGTSATGTILAPLPDSVIAALMTSRVYVNIRTAANPNGEIRGQVNLSAGTHLIARFDGLQENPSLINSGKGIAAITLASVGSVGLAYDISVNGLSGPITGAHFHFGKIGVNGPIVFDITSSFNGQNAKGVWRTGSGGLNDTMIAGLLTGKLYLNVHTSANPGGEIRGQVVLAAGFGANANLNGASENPPVVTPALGTSEYTFTDYGLVFNVTVDGLSGPITAAHFHVGDSGVNGPIVFDITSTFSNNTATGRWRASTAVGDLTPALIKDLFANRLYVNVHTAANPGGEIRGQIKMKNGSGIGAFFTGAQEVPPTITTASGTAALYTVATGLQYFITVTGLSGPITGAHFHFGSIKEAGPIVKDITSTFTGTTASGVWLIAEATPFNDSLRRALVNGKIYLNVHTAANPSGEIRGQVFLTAGTGMTSVLTGNQEVPSLLNAGKGTGSYTLTRGGLGFNIAVNGLSGPITAAHFHIGDVGKAGPIVFDIMSSVSGNNIVGYWRPVVTIDSLFNALLTGRIYVNVHTAANPGGEIRGQVFISEGFGITNQITRTQVVPPTTTNARGTGSATGTDAGIVYFNTFDGLIGDSFDSPPTGAHFHNAPIGVNGPIVKDLMSNIMGNNIVGAWKRTDVMMPLTNMFVSEAYIQNIYLDIHTAEFPNGEIRGQFRSGALPIIPVQLISSIDVTPENSINTINTSHCVEGLVRDQSGVALSGLRVDYVVRGSNPMSGFAITDTAGKATFCYTGIITGRDTIIGTILDLVDSVYKLWEVPLPVELASFSATTNKNDVILNWTTAEEINNSGFDIERKLITKTEWTKAGFVEGNGTIADPMNYAFTDKSLNSGKYNYRLKQIDFNGNYEYFNLTSEIEVGIPAKFNLAQNYPNPFNPTTKIDFQLPEDGNVNLSVYDNSGRLVASILSGFRTAGYYTINFNASNLSSGIYFYKMEYNNISKVLKMSLIK